MRVTLIVCPNGYGHFRRARLLAIELLSRNIEVSICTNETQWRNYEAAVSRQIDQEEAYAIKDCEWLPDARAYRKLTRPLDGFKQLVAEYGDSFIVSDNYIEPLQHTDFGLVFANFFWHRELGLRDPGWGELEQAVTDRGTKFAGNVFAKPYASEKAGFECFPIFGARKRQAPSRGYIVLVLGLGPWVAGYEGMFSQYLSDQAEDYSGTCFVDPMISIDALEPIAGIAYEPAKISDHLIAHAEAVIGRPSLGIVSDCMCASVPFFPITVPDDLEALYNKSLVFQLFKTTNDGYDIKNCRSIREGLANCEFPLFGEGALASRIIQLMG